MSLKRSFIQMSITKQIYCGLFGMAVLTCTNVFILIFCTSLILTTSSISQLTTNSSTSTIT